MLATALGVPIYVILSNRKLTAKLFVRVAPYVDFKRGGSIASEQLPRKMKRDEDIPQYPQGRRFPRVVRTGEDVYLPVELKLDVIKRADLGYFEAVYRHGTPPGNGVEVGI
jgi:hypothetical protein